MLLTTVIGLHVVERRYRIMQYIRLLYYCHCLALPYQGREYKTEIREKKKRDVRKKTKLRLCSVREFPYALDSILPRIRFSGVWIFKFGRFNSYERGKRMKQNQAQ